jgi:transketolase C-terminal domain/subunit
MSLEHKTATTLMDGNDVVLIAIGFVVTMNHGSIASFALPQPLAQRVAML